MMTPMIATACFVAAFPSAVPAITSTRFAESRGCLMLRAAGNKKYLHAMFRERRVQELHIAIPGFLERSLLLHEH